MKKWENPKILNLNLINTEQICKSRMILNGILECTSCGACVQVNDFDTDKDDLVCACGSNSFRPACNTCPS